MTDARRRRLALVLLVIGGLASAATQPARYYAYAGELDDEVIVGGGQAEVRREYKVDAVPYEVRKGQAQGELRVGTPMIIGPPRPLDRGVSVEVSQFVDGQEVVHAESRELVSWIGFALRVDCEPDEVCPLTLSVRVRDPDPSAPERTIVVTLHLELRSEWAGSYSTVAPLDIGGGDAPTDERSLFALGGLMLGILGGVIAGTAIAVGLERPTARKALAFIATQSILAGLMLLGAYLLLIAGPGRHDPETAVRGAIVSLALAGAVAIGVARWSRGDPGWLVGAEAIVLVFGGLILAHLIATAPPSTAPAGVAAGALFGGLAATGMVVGFQGPRDEQRRSLREMRLIATHAPLAVFVLLAPLGLVPSFGGWSGEVTWLIGISALALGVVIWWRGSSWPLVVADLWICLVVAPWQFAGANALPLGLDVQPADDFLAFATFALGVAAIACAAGGRHPTPPVLVPGWSPPPPRRSWGRRRPSPPPPPAVGER